MKTKYNSTLSTDGKSDGQTQNHSIRRRWPALALGGFLFTSIGALSAPPVEAQCQQWDVSGKWKIKQGSFTLPVVLSQNGKTVSGAALHRDAIVSESSELGGLVKFRQSGNLAGSVNGTVEGDSFDVQINWERGGVGIYRGTIGRNGVMKGVTYDKNKPSSTATWRSSKAMKCADEYGGNPTESASEKPVNPAPPPPQSTGPAAPPPRVLKGTGKKPQTQASAAAPTITAHPRVVSIPEGQSEGSVTVTWDGGPNHPDAEARMKDGMAGEETFLGQGKGTRSVKVQRAKNYQFILTDAGQQLARAVVISTR